MTELSEGRKRRFFSDADSDADSDAAPLPPPPPPTHDSSSATTSVGEERGGRERDRSSKRKSRWGAGTDKVQIPGMQTIIPSGLTPDQVKGYVTSMRIEEISAKLRSGDVVPKDGERSPSPPPEYGPGGIRINTREFRYRKRLEDERHKLVEEAVKSIPGFAPPSDYKKQSRLTEKVFIPYRDFPEINFIGQLIGPRGKTLQKMEADSGAKISIRGKGSVKDGKISNNGSEEEDQHCLIMADSEEKIKKAVKLILDIIEKASTIPEEDNELKKMQLRELASLNGTLRDDEALICNNCGATGHRKYECPEMKNFTINLVCKICNGAGHTARDCMQRNDPEALAAARARDEKLDNEYASLMAELKGEKPPLPLPPSFSQQLPPPPPFNNSSAPSSAPTSAPPSSIPPWNQGGPHQHQQQHRFPPPPPSNMGHYGPPPGSRFPPPPHHQYGPPPPGTNPNQAPVFPSHPPPPPPGLARGHPMPLPPMRQPPPPHFQQQHHHPQQWMPPPPPHFPPTNAMDPAIAHQYAYYAGGYNNYGGAGDWNAPPPPPPANHEAEDDVPPPPPPPPEDEHVPPPPSDDIPPPPPPM